MGQCSLKGCMIYSDLNLWALFWSSNLIPMVHLWSSNTDLSLFRQKGFLSPSHWFLVCHFLSSSLPLPRPLNLSFFLKKRNKLFLSFSQDYSLAHLCPHPALFSAERVRPPSKRELLDNLYYGKQIKISDYKRTGERTGGGITSFFFSPLFPPIESQTCIWMGRAGCIQTYTWIRLCWGFPTHP